MKNTGRNYRKLLTLITLIGLSLSLTSCFGPKEPETVVFEDMKSTFESSQLLAANIGLFSKLESDDSVTYMEGGSGVIFQQDNSTYYALTAAHVVSHEDTEILVFTPYTEMVSEDIPGVDYTVLAPETYEAMHTATIEYVSTRDDLAIISFTSDEDLRTVTIAAEDPKKDDRIMCIGNPQNDWFAISYGRVTSGMETFGDTQGYPSHVMRHTAYINVGSSGGAALNEQMELVGTIPGGNFSPGGQDFNYGVLIPASEIRLCIEEWQES